MVRISETVEHFDVLIVGAGISGVGGAYHLTTSAPAPASSCSKRGKLRRHLDHAQISGHPLGQRPLHLRLPLQALDHRADRDGSGNSEIHGRGHRRERPRPAYSLPAPDRRREPGPAKRTSGPSTPPTPQRASRSASPPTSCGCARATTAIPKATRRSGTAWKPSREPSSTRRPGPPISITRARTSSSSARAPRRRRSFRRWRKTSATSLCCSARRPISEPAATRSRSPTSCGRWPLTRRGSTRSYAGRSCTTSRCSPAERSPSRRR